MVQSRTFVIASGDTASETELDGSAADGAICVADKGMGSVKFPAAMTGTKLLIRGKGTPDGTWGDVLDEDGVTPLEILKSVSDWVPIPFGAFKVPFIQLISDAAEGADRTFEFFVKQYPY